jgi:hypothetical protein
VAFSNFDPRLPQPVVVITNGGTRVEARVKNWSQSFTFSIIADVQKWDLGEQRTYSRNEDLFFGKLLVFRVPKELKTRHIEGKTLDGKPISIQAGVAANNEFLQYLSEVDQDDETVVTFSVPTPRNADL